MSDNEARDRPQKMVYWPQEGFNAFGEYVAGNPEEISVRVEQDILLQSELSKHTDEVAYEINVDKDTPIGGLLYFGELTDLELGSSVDVYQISRFNKVPDVKGRKFDRRLTARRDRHQKKITVAPLTHMGVLLHYDGQPIFYTRGLRKSSDTVVETDRPNPLV